MIRQAFGLCRYIGKPGVLDGCSGPGMGNGLKNRMADISAFLRESPAALTKYDEPLARRLIETFTVYTATAVAADKFIVEFKSGVTVDVEE